jgi:putative FmdB family regulatory protein
MPWYEHSCGNCNEEFEDLYSAQSPIPTLCPNCGVDGQVKRLIPSIVHGRVPLTGHELKQQIKKDTASLRAKVATNENVKANIVGETKYNEHVVSMNKLKDTYKS